MMKNLILVVFLSSGLFITTFHANHADVVQKKNLILIQKLNNKRN